MARYVDVEKIIRETKNHMMDEVYPEWSDRNVIDALGRMARLYKKIIDEAPTADVEEVKHGEWQRQKNGFYFVCSVCGKASATKGNYCHSCGAEMDKENAQ